MRRTPPWLAGRSRGIVLFAERACAESPYSASNRLLPDEDVWRAYSSSARGSERRRSALSELLRRHSRLLQSISDRAQTRSRGGVEGADYDGYTVIGAVVGYDRFDPVKASSSLGVFVCYVARQYVLDVVERGCVETVLKLPVRAHRHRVWASGAYDAVPGYNEEYAEKYGLTEDHRRAYAELAPMFTYASLNKPYSTDSAEAHEWIEVLPDSDSDFEEGVVESMSSAQVWSAFRDTLPSHLVGTYDSVVAGDMSIGEYALATGLPQSTVSGRVWRVRQLAKSWIAKSSAVQGESVA